jgi:hypothetical protein
MSSVGAVPQWWAMEGVHAPYDLLEDYKIFLAPLDIRGFAPEMVKWGVISLARKIKA